MNKPILSHLLTFTMLTLPTYNANAVRSTDSMSVDAHNFLNHTEKLRQAQVQQQNREHELERQIHEFRENHRIAQEQRDQEFAQALQLGEIQAEKNRQHLREAAMRAQRSLNGEPQPEIFPRRQSKNNATHTTSHLDTSAEFPQTIQADTIKAIMGLDYDRREYYLQQMQERETLRREEDRETGLINHERMKALENSSLDSTNTTELQRFHARVHLYQQKRAELNQQQQERESINQLRQQEDLIELENIQQELQEYLKRLRRLHAELAGLSQEFSEIRTMCDTLLEEELSRSHSLSALVIKPILGATFLAGGLYALYHYGTGIYKKIARYCCSRNAKNTKPQTNNITDDNDKSDTSHATQNTAK